MTTTTPSIYNKLIGMNFHITSSGNFYVVGIYDSNLDTLVIWKSTDNGVNWTDVTQLSETDVFGNGTAVFLDIISALDSNDNIHVLTSQSTTGLSNSTRYRVFTTSSDTWSGSWTTIYNNPFVNIPVGHRIAITIDSSDYAHVAYVLSDGSGFEYRNNISGWSTPETINVAYTAGNTTISLLAIGDIIEAVYLANGLHVCYRTRDGTWGSEGEWTSSLSLAVLQGTGRPLVASSSSNVHRVGYYAHSGTFYICEDDNNITKYGSDLALITPTQLYIDDTGLWHLFWTGNSASSYRVYHSINSDTGQYNNWGDAFPTETTSAGNFTIYWDYNNNNTIAGKIYYIQAISGGIFVTKSLASGTPVADNQPAYLDVLGITTDNQPAYLVGTGKLLISHAYVKLIAGGGTQSTNNQPTYLIGQDTVINNQPAYLFSGTPVADNQESYLVGYDQATDNQPSYLDGYDVAIDNQAVYLAGQSSEINNQSAYLSGSITVEDNQISYLAGKDIATNSQLSYLIGQASLSNNQESYLTGKDVYSDNQTVYLLGSITIEDSQPSYLVGRDTATNNQPSYIIGYSTLTNNQPSYLVGSIDVIDNQIAYLIGQSAGVEASDNQIVYLKGYDISSDNQPVYLIGQSSIENNQIVYLIGEDYHTDNQPSYLIGQSSIEDNQQAYLFGIEIYTDNQSAFIVGQSSYSDNIPAFIEAVGISVSSLDAYLTGIEWQELSPSGDITVNNWTNELGGVPLYQSIDEDIADDNDYVWKDEPSYGDYFEVGIADPSFTIGSGDVAVYWRGAVLESGNPQTLIMELREGGAVVATDVQSLTSTFTTYEYILTSEEKASITNWDNLSIRVTYSGEV